jgi:hypothetical protein
LEKVIVTLAVKRRSSLIGSFQSQAIRFLSNIARIKLAPNNILPRFFVSPSFFLRQKNSDTSTIFRTFSKRNRM